MDPVMVLIILRGLLSSLIIVGGIVAIFMGKNLYLRGVGLSPDDSTVAIEGDEFKVHASLKTVGAVVMTTSVAWGGLGVLSFPTYQRVAEGLEEAVALNYAERFRRHAENASIIAGDASISVGAAKEYREAAAEVAIEAAADAHAAAAAATEAAATAEAAAEAAASSE